MMANKEALSVLQDAIENDDPYAVQCIKNEGGETGVRCLRYGDTDAFAHMVVSLAVDLYNDVQKNSDKEVDVDGYVQALGASVKGAIEVEKISAESVS